MQKQTNKNAEKYYRKSKFKSLLGRGKYLYYRSKETVQGKLTLQLMMVFLVCFMTSWILQDVFYGVLKKVDYRAKIDYSSGIERLRNSASNIADDLMRIEDFDEKYDLSRKIMFSQESRIIEAEDQEDMASSEETHSDSSGMVEHTTEGTLDNEVMVDVEIQMSEEELMERLSYEIRHLSAKAYITDYDGNTLLSNANNGTVQFDIHAMVRESLKSFETRSYTYNGIYTIVYPVTMGELNGYLIIQGAPRGQVIYDYDGSEFGEFLAFIASVIVFVGLFFYLTRKKIEYIEYLANSILKISAGDLKIVVEEIGTDELNIMAQNVNTMTKSLDEKITAERRAEQAKGELITNVSHDLRTPLTSIIGYLGLIRDDKFENDMQMKEFLNIAYKESDKIKKMLDDLFEYSRLSSNAQDVKDRLINIGDMMHQITDEYRIRFENRGLDVVVDLMDDVLIHVDPDKMHRVFNNLIVNTLKYAEPFASIVIRQSIIDNHTIIDISNGCNLDENEDLEKLFDRFYRGDKSRTSAVAGSGLGLAICKQIVNLHNGDISASLNKGILSIKVSLPIKVNMD